VGVRVVFVAARVVVERVVGMAVVVEHTQDLLYCSLRKSLSHSIEKRRDSITQHHHIIARRTASHTIAA
jgi:hypothetical protein